MLAALKLLRPKAMAASSLLMGTFFGLLLAGYMTWVHGRRVGRIVQLIQVGGVWEMVGRWKKNHRKNICNSGLENYGPHQNMQTYLT